MDAGRYLIRFVSAGIPAWFGNNPSVETLAKGFKLTDKAHSVYEVADGEEECLAAAAHCLANPIKARPEAISVLRLEMEDLSRFGIGLDAKKLGTTGVPRWDHRHRDILADDAEKLRKLVGFILELCQRGHDRVRRIEKELLVRTLNSFSQYEPCACPGHVKTIANWCQSGQKNILPDLTLSRVSEEMTIVEFDDEIIEPGAACLSSGDMLADWFRSLEAVRNRYTEEYIPTITRRFGLGK